jgi:hypothetical protein
VEGTRGTCPNIGVKPSALNYLVKAGGNLLATCFHVGFLLGLIFDPEDERDMFLRKVGSHSVTIPEDRSFHNHRCENLKSCNSEVTFISHPPNLFL